MISVNKLVSVGLPAYNKPKHLDRALSSLCGQTYKNIEILISDDCSPDREVEAVAKKYMASDPRVKYYRQPKNIGPEKNFKYVLESSRGEYFMWAADDDLRDSACIESYLNNIGDANAIFTTYVIKDFQSLEENVVQVPVLNGVASKVEMHAFMDKPCPSMIYGMYKTKLAKKVLPDTLFDFWDFYFVLKYISCYGIRTVSTEPLYVAAIEGGYKLNPFGKKFSYNDFLWRTFPLMAASGCHGFVRGVKFIAWIWKLNSAIKHNNGRI